MSDLHLPLRLGFVMASLMLAACGGGGAGDGGNSSASAPVSPVLPASSVAPSLIAPPRPVAQSDLEIATSIYSGTARTPAGFYVESSAHSAELTTTAHLKNTDVDESLEETEPRFELCTNDWNQALSWSEMSAQHSNQYSQLVATNDDPRYFEFVRDRGGTPRTYEQSRIFKCAYLERTDVNLRSASGAAGTLNLRPLSAEEVQRLSEYLWQFTAYNNFGHVVLKSAGSSGASFEHTLYIASLVRGGTSPQCDRIDIIGWRHSADTQSGALTLSLHQQFSFGAREEGGVAQLCSG